MASDAEEFTAIDVGALLRFRTAAAEPEDVPSDLCQATEHEKAWATPPPGSPEAEEAGPSKKEKKQMEKKAKGKGKSAHASPAAPETAPWRRGREEQSGEGGDGTAGTEKEGAPWRREGKTGSPQLGPSPTPPLKEKAPWRAGKSPGSPDVNELMLGDSQGLSDEEDGPAAGEGGAFEVMMSGAGDLPDTKPDDSKEPNADAAKATRMDSFASMEADADAEAGDDAEEPDTEWIAKQDGPADEWKKDGWKKEWKGGGDWKGGGAGGVGWKESSKEEGGVPLPADVTVSGAPPPPAHHLAGTWYDSLGNMIQVPLFPPVAYFAGTGGSSAHELTLDKWGRLWCGNGVLHQVGYSGGPMAQDLPPSHLSFRTTAWKFSVWERIAYAEAPPPPPEGGDKRRKNAGGKGGKKGRDGDSKGKGSRQKGSDRSEPQDAPAPKPPSAPTLGDFLSFPELGQKEKKAKPKKEG